MPEFRIPTSAAEWEDVEVEKQDDALWDEWLRSSQVTDAPKLAAASRLLERERCVERLAEWLASTYGDYAPSNDIVGAEVEARRILEDAK